MRTVAVPLRNWVVRALFQGLPSQAVQLTVLMEVLFSTDIIPVMLASL